VPLPEAEKAFRFAMIQRKRGWHRNGDQFKVGDYQLDAVNEQGVIAGCHRIGWDEIERFAKTQGWI
jgi:predicted Abi (CAAX) family protease